MPTFDTPEPISATLTLAMGDVRIGATDRTTTAIDVKPSDASNPEDVRAAEQTRVEYADRRLLVKPPKAGTWLSRSGGGSIDVTIELPAGSDVHGTAASADFRCGGRLGECQVKTAIGHLEVEQAAKLTLKCGTGDIAVDRATGHAELTMGSGDVRARALDGSATIKNSNGDTWVGAGGGDLRVNAANGGITVDVARASLVAKSTNGDVRLGEAVRGTVVLETRLGDVEVGIREGTAAWLDVSASAGKVHNALEAAQAPGSSADTVEVRARTSIGDIVIGRPREAVAG
jgi:hypothetical protein